MVADTRTKVQRRDRWVSWIVIVVFVVALILGWVVKTVAENRYVDYSDGTIQVRYPEGWILLEVESPVIFQAADKPTGVRTALIIEQRPLATSAARPLSVLLQTLTLERGSSWMAYRVLETQEGVTIAGWTATHVAFSYVETNPNPFMETVPVVMRGADYMIPDGEQVLIFTVVAPESEYDQAQRYLEDFVRSFQK
jgi:hypothetical protein